MTENRDATLARAGRASLAALAFFFLLLVPGALVADNCSSLSDCWPAAGAAAAAAAGAGALIGAGAGLAGKGGPGSGLGAAEDIAEGLGELGGGLKPPQDSDRTGSNVPRGGDDAAETQPPSPTPSPSPQPTPDSPPETGRILDGLDELGGGRKTPKGSEEGWDPGGDSSDRLQDTTRRRDD